MTTTPPADVRAAIALSELLDRGDLRRLADAAAGAPSLLAGIGDQRCQGMRPGGPWDALVEVLEAAARIAGGRLT